MASAGACLPSPSLISPCVAVIHRPGMDKSCTFLRTHFHTILYIYTVQAERVRYFVLLYFPTNLGQFSKQLTDLKSACPDIFKTPPTCTI